MADRLPVTVFISIRPQTFYNSGISGTLDAYHPRAFTVGPPRVDEVVAKRLRHGINLLNRGIQFGLGENVHDSINLWIWTAYQIKAIADRNGYTDIIAKAGGNLLADSCPLNANIFPLGTKVVATDSAKHAHYAPAIAGVDVWLGTMEECIDCAVTGKWKAGLKP